MGSSFLLTPSTRTCVHTPRRQFALTLERKRPSSLVKLSLSSMQSSWLETFSRAKSRFSQKAVWWLWMCVWRYILESSGGPMIIHRKRLKKYYNSLGRIVLSFSPNRSKVSYFSKTTEILIPYMWESVWLNYPVLRTYRVWMKSWCTKVMNIRGINRLVS